MKIYPYILNCSQCEQLHYSLLANNFTIRF